MCALELQFEAEGVILPTFKCLLTINAGTE